MSEHINAVGAKESRLQYGIGVLGYAAARGISRFLGRFYWRTTIDGSEHIPETGAYLLCSVHRSNVDAPLTTTMTKRRMRYLSKDSMFKVKWLGKLFLAMGAIPITRGAIDRQSMQMCVDELQRGWPLMMFPEGTRGEGLEIGQLHEGAAYIALRVGVPIIPVGITDSSRAQPKGKFLLRPIKLRIVIGEPIYLPKPEGERVPRSSIRSGTELVRERMQELFDIANGRMVQESR